MSERMIPLKIADMAVAACNEEIAKLQAENARLKAEVERLRKAGDELQSLAFEYVAETYVPNGRHNRITEAWNEAKEGKQS